MPEFQKHEPGTFCWAELSTTDIDAAVKLYPDLFGWEVQEQPLPDNGVYYLFAKDGKPVAGGSTQMPQEKEMGVPPHWNMYVAVEDAEQTAKKAESLGGTILAPAFDVMELGRMAVFSDPAGAVLSVWEAKQMAGAAVLREDGAMSWNEVMAADIDKAIEFYKQLFDWDTEPFPGPQEYTIFKKGDEQIAGAMKVQTPDQPPAWMLHFGSPEVDVVADKVKSAGGQILMGPDDMPGVGRVTVAMDPQGAFFGAFTGEAK